VSEFILEDHYIQGNKSDLLLSAANKKIAVVELFLKLLQATVLAVINIYTNACLSAFFFENCKKIMSPWSPLRFFFLSRATVKKFNKRLLLLIIDFPRF
jgi:hypothetical protein